MTTMDNTTLYSKNPERTAVLPSISSSLSTKWRGALENSECPRGGDDAGNDEITNRHLKTEGTGSPGGTPFVFTPAAFRDLTRHDRLFGGKRGGRKNRSLARASTELSRTPLSNTLRIRRRNGPIATERDVPRGRVGTKRKSSRSRGPPS